MIEEVSGRSFRSQALRRLTVLAVFVFAVGATATRTEAQEAGSGPSRAAGCYQLEHGPWGAELKVGIYLSPSQVPMALRLDTVRSDTYLLGEWFVAHALTANAPSQRVTRIWRPFASDSVFIKEELAMVGFHIRAEVKEDGLQGKIIAVTDMIIAGMPAEVSAPLVGRRIPCLPGSREGPSL